MYPFPIGSTPQKNGTRNLLCIFNYLFHKGDDWPSINHGCHGNCLKSDANWSVSELFFSWNFVEIMYSLLRRVDNKQRFDAFRLLVFPSARSKQTTLRRAYGCFCSAVNAFQIFLRHKWIHLDHRRRLQFWRYTILLLAKLTHRIKLRPVTLIFTVVWRIKQEWKSNMIPCALWV